MAKLSLSTRDSFTSKFGVIAAAAGSAIGLGNIWRFPYVTGEYGGAAFLIVYIGFIVLIGLPVMLSELTIGRKAQRNPYGAFKKLGKGKRWPLVGMMGIVAAFTILSFYSAVAGWTLEYLFDSFQDAFAGKNREEIEGMFEAFRSGVFRPIFWQLLFLSMTAWIVLSGIKNGIERYSKVLMPILLLLVIILDIRAITLPGANEGLAFLFKPDFSKLTGQGVLEALGQAFFSLSIGMGTLITYGSYINKKENLVNTAVTVSCADTFIAILAGIAIFPAVFAFGIDPESEPGLVFITLPNIFQQIPGGYLFSIIFFLLLVVAALTSSISILEVVVAYFVEELKLKRKYATIMAILTVAVLGILCTLSLGAIPEIQVFGMSVFSLLDFGASNVLLPLGGLFIVVFIGWFLSKRTIASEISNKGAIKVKILRPYLFLVRFVAPIAITIVFLYGIGLIRF